MATVRALQECFVGHGGMPVRLEEGAEYDADSSLVRAFPALFTDPVQEPQRPTFTRKGAKGSDG